VEIIDAHIHSSPVTVKRPAAPMSPLSRDVRSNTYAFPIQSVLVAMDAVGVDVALLRDGDHEYAATTYPRRFVSCAHFDPKAPNLEELVAQARSGPGVLATVLSLFNAEKAKDFQVGVFQPLLAAAEKHALPVFVWVWNERPHLTIGLDSVALIARKHPDLQLIVDHCGLPQPPAFKLDDPPFARLPELIDLAQYPNVALKWSGAPSYSKEPYPYRDLWPPMHQVIRAFGPERMIWGSNLTRFATMFRYSELLDYLRYSDEISESEKTWILGGSLRRVLRWPHASSDESANRVAGAVA